MPRRITILGLMGVIVVVGLVCAALRSGSQRWYCAVYTMTVGILLGASLAAVSRGGTFWRAFALVGWGYFWLGAGPSSSGKEPRLLTINQDLLTTGWWSDMVANPTFAKFPHDPDNPNLIPAMYVTNDVLNIFYIRIMTGHACLTLFLALGGGLLARSWARRSRHPGGVGWLGPGLIVLVSGGILVVLWAAPETGTRAVYTATALALLLGSTAACSRGPFWRGFAVVGWVYFLEGLAAWHWPRMDTPVDRINRALLPANWLDWICLILVPGPDLPSLLFESTPLQQARVARLGRAILVGHCLLTLAFAVAGGLIARALASRSRSEPRGESPPLPPPAPGPS